MELIARTVLVLRHPDRKRVLLLKRSPAKKLFPNLITGIGGNAELGDGECSDLMRTVRREFSEETTIPEETVADVMPRLVTIATLPDQQVVIVWCTGSLTAVPENLECPEGELFFVDAESLPLEQFIPTAAAAIPFILSLEGDDRTVYNGVFTPDKRLITNK